MKPFLKFVISQLCCLSLIATDTLARDNDRNSRSSSRPNVRKSNDGPRNPITGSKASKPAQRSNARTADRPTASKPQTRSQERPQSRPAERPNRPETRPADRPGNRPDNRPNQPGGNRPNQPDNRPNQPGNRPNQPGNRPNQPDNRPNRPDNRPNRPDNLPNLPGNRPNQPDNRPNQPGNRPNRPDNRPNLPDNRPNRSGNPNQRPQTRPGEVIYPNPSRPDGPGGNTKPGALKPDRKPNVRPGQNTKTLKRPDLDNNRITNNSGNNSNNRNWWSNNKNSNNRTVINNGTINRGNKNVQINNNFQRNVNWSTNQQNWGYNPWWNRPATRPWYGGSWNCGWNSHYNHAHSYYSGAYWGGYHPPGYAVYHDHDDDDDVAQAIGWGLVGWGLGSMVYNSGYQSYSNPYPAQPVQSSHGSEVTYTQPITVVAAQTAPPAEEVEKITQASESHIVESQDAFKQRNYLKALESANKAVAEAPGDGALHEYRALVLFALGKYSESAGVLNPVLAGGPGWDWSTMISLYDSQETYTSQLEALVNYSRGRPESADARFLLGYHYMVCGYLDRASAEFAEAAKLQPKDTVSAQLRDLTAASSNNGNENPPANAETPAASAPAPQAVPLEQLTGTWVSNRADQGTVTLAFKGDGKFIWSYKNDKTSNEFGGDYSMNDNGLLVLDSEQSQMVASVALQPDNQLKFVLSGGPPGDPGLTFAKQ